ncbi:MAG: FHA domain-containing protein [Planctomycetota bacterium]
MNLEDAIYKLLGVSPAEQPPDSYRLLGIAPFESDPEVIRNAAARQILFVRQPHDASADAFSDKLIRLVTEARSRLLNPASKRLYDDSLRRGEQPGGQLSDGKRFAGPTSGDSRADSRAASSAAVAAPPRSAERARPARREIASLTKATPREMRTGVCEAEEDTKLNHGPREWVVGVDASCDFVVKSPYVSRRHCRLWETEGLFWVEDLGSRNGTHINHCRIEGRQVVDQDDVVTLGSQARLPWPPTSIDPGGQHEVQLITIGRGRANDVVLRDASVSRHHAQLSVFADRVLVEDLGSTNGTYVGGSAVRVNRQAISRSDMIRVGRFQLPACELIDGGRTELLAKE